MITKVKEDSPARGTIPVHSRIYSIDGNDVTHSTKAQCIEHIKQIGPLVKFTISAEPDEIGIIAFDSGKQQSAGTHPTQPTSQPANGILDEGLDTYGDASPTQPPLPLPPVPMFGGRIVQVFKSQGQKLGISLAGQ